jgi:hypothetical protein
VVSVFVLYYCGFCFCVVVSVFVLYYCGLRYNSTTQRQNPQHKNRNHNSTKQRQKQQHKNRNHYTKTKTTSGFCLCVVLLWFAFLHCNSSVFVLYYCDFCLCVVLLWFLFLCCGFCLCVVLKCFSLLNDVYLLGCQIDDWFMIIECLIHIKRICGLMVIKHLNMSLYLYLKHCIK